MQIKKAHALHGEINIPGDKSISHRAIMFVRFPTAQPKSPIS